MAPKTKKKQLEVLTEKVLPQETSSDEIDKVFKALNEEPVPLEVDGIDIVEVPLDEPAPLTLTKDELYKLQISQLQVRAAEAEVALQMLQRDLYVQKVDPEGKLKTLASIIRTRSDEASLGKKAYAEITKEIEARLGISLKEYAYDDQNGVLSKVDQ